MGKRFRKFVLSIAKVYPPLYRWLKKYFIEHPEYEFVFECRVSERILGSYHPAGVISLNLGNIARLVRYNDDELVDDVVRVVLHEELHRVFHKIRTIDDYLEWFRERYRALPYPTALIDLEERVIDTFVDEAYWYNGELPAQVPDEVELDRDDEQMLRNMHECLRRILYDYYDSV